MEFTLRLCINLLRLFLCGWGKITVGVLQPCVDEQRISASENCLGALTSQFVYSAGEVPTAEPVASLRGTARKTK